MSRKRDYGRQGKTGGVGIGGLVSGVRGGGGGISDGAKGSGGTGAKNKLEGQVTVLRTSQLLRSLQGAVAMASKNNAGPY